jgi:uncharacterized protein (DUF433 family)
MRTSVDIGTLIERSPEIRKGRPCIAGTGVTVRRIVGWHNLGLGPEEIAAKMEHLTLAQIHAALAYYHANRDEIDTDIAAEDAAVEQVFPAHVAIREAWSVRNGKGAGPARRRPTMERHSGSRPSQ